MISPSKNVPNLNEVGSMLGTLKAFNGATLPNLPYLPNLTAWAHTHTPAHVYTRARIYTRRNTLGRLGRLGRCSDNAGLNAPHIIMEVRKVGN